MLSITLVLAMWAFFGPIMLAVGIPVALYESISEWLSSNTAPEWLTGVWDWLTSIF